MKRSLDTKDTNMNWNNYQDRVTSGIISDNGRLLIVREWDENEMPTDKFQLVHIHKSVVLYTGTTQDECKSFAETIKGLI